MQQSTRLINTVKINYKIGDENYSITTTSGFQKRGRKEMCINKNCCIPRVAINGYTIGAAFAMNTVYDFSNSENCDKFLLILQADIPSQITIVPVNLVTTTGTVTTLPLRNSLGNNIMSDQLVGVHSLCVVFGNNTTHLKVLKAFNRCGAEIRLRKSAFYETEEVIEEPEI